MCTVMRKLVRGTPRGKALKSMKRRLKIQMRNVRELMTSDKTGDVSGLLRKFAALKKLRSGIRI